MQYLIKNIQWETDWERVALPTELTIQTDADDANLAHEVCDILSDTFGWLVISFEIHPV